MSCVFQTLDLKNEVHVLMLNTANSLPSRLSSQPLSIILYPTFSTKAVFYTRQFIKIFLSLTSPQSPETISLLLILWVRYHVSMYQCIHVSISNTMYPCFMSHNVLQVHAYYQDFFLISEYSHCSTWQKNFLKKWVVCIAWLFQVIPHCIWINHLFLRYWFHFL